MQLDNNGFTTFKMNDLTHVQMLIIQKMWNLIISYCMCFIKLW